MSSGGENLEGEQEERTNMLGSGEVTEGSGFVEE